MTSSHWFVDRSFLCKRMNGMSTWNSGAIGRHTYSRRHSPLNTVTSSTRRTPRCCVVQSSSSRLKTRNKSETELRGPRPFRQPPQGLEAVTIVERTALPIHFSARVTCYDRRPGQHHAFSAHSGGKHGRLLGAGATSRIPCWAVDHSNAKLRPVDMNRLATPSRMRSIPSS